MEYKISKKAENPRESVIEMHGKPITFNLHQMQANIRNAEKTIVELDAQAKVNRAKMTNIEEHHPFVKEMSEQDLFTAHMYQEAKALAIVSEKKADEFREAKATDEASLVELFEKLPELKADVEAFDTKQMEADKPKHAGEEEKVEEEKKD